MYDSLILSHLQFGITCLGFECNRLFKLLKRALRIMTNSKNNAHTEPIFNDLKLLKLYGIFDIQCMEFFYKFTNNTLPKYFHFLFKYNREIYEIVTRYNNQLHLFPTRTPSAENVLGHHIPKLIDKFPRHIKDKIRTHSIHEFSSRLKAYIIDSYSYVCSYPQCYVCNNSNYVQRQKLVLNRLILWRIYKFVVIVYLIVCISRQGLRNKW